MRVFKKSLWGVFEQFSPPNKKAAHQTMDSLKIVDTSVYYSMPRFFFTSAVMSVSDEGSKYAKPADEGISPAVLKIAI